METPWNEILFFPGEDAEALKTRFVELCAHHKNRYSAYEVCEYIFRDLREPGLRAGKAAEIWGKDLDIQERIRVLMLKGPPVADCSEGDLIRRALQIADDAGENAKDRIAAIRLAGELQGMVKKSVDLKASAPANENGADWLAALAAKLPT